MGPGLFSKDTTPDLNELARNANLTISTTSVEISPARKRMELVITNVSTGGQIVSLGIGAEAAANTGIVLTPYSAYSANNSEGMTVSQLRIAAIASAGGAQIAIFER